jgi:hypothetical protein
MAGFSKFLILAGIVMWVTAFFVGPDNGAGTGNRFIWNTGKWGIGIVIVGVVLRLVLFLIPSKRKAIVLRRKRHGEERKCTECGRPAVPGSQYCRYHTDVMNRPEEESSKGSYEGY